ncbi:class I mannose-6-phosphate isomerase [Oceanotoga sp. DSM 15011]|uniref:Mannose-6-phosphate isomerase type 1 n=1 Tax=Oceanotoga teriensis TaxID=515440 RepID=A0AA45C5V1_9BACT|nr:MULTISPECIES: type I phosphomannose isomerase catalytic subunit [Oceanotoga]MDN5343729.1 mannose-6-phosphate isomerase [Oceanotoga sp.]MDO7977413.1 class I mannose-6-phosphate isomerase [Oceanotoga teriensis]PWJ89636.1 mannose-6-phosphate isomerase type 1 [Oceanotoga teriensis]UYO98905.1 class I mannose-6-phosphate isomerase [Oceanotoga sp. DSM 15011]
MINEPLICKPVLSEKVWGNKDLNEVFKHNLGENPVGEVWLFSVVEGMETTLKGVETGKTYKSTDIIKDFPLLLKLISTSSWLSVQVHPDDDFAEKLENQSIGKSEAWYFLKDGGKIKVSNDNEGVMNSFKDNSWDKCLEEIEFNKFDTIFIPAGTVHTLGPNCTILEIQQSSDITYRLYDWGRPREIHVEKSKEVLKNVKTSYCVNRSTNGMETKYFSFNKFKNEEKIGKGIYVSLKDYKTIYLDDKVKYYFEGEWVEYKINMNGWKGII